MRKLSLLMMAVFLSLASIPAQLKAGTETSTFTTITAKADKTVVSAEATVLLTRLDEIKAIDKSLLTSTDKQLLRKEVRSIKSQLSAVGGGVYLSVGAILLIVLLLVILL